MIDLPVSFPRTGEWRRVIAISMILIGSATIQGICDVLSTTGVVNFGGHRGVVVLWAIDAGIAVAGIGALSRWVDSVDRRKIGTWMLIAFALSYLAIWVQTRDQGAHTLLWGLLGVIDTLQSNLVVLIAWALARDLFSEGEAVRLFGLLGGLAYFGTMAGTGLSAWVAHKAANTWLLPICVLVALLTAGCVYWLVPAVHRQAESITDTDGPTPLGYLWREPTLRALCAVVAGNAVCWTMMSFGVLIALQLAHPGTGGSLAGAGEMQESYGSLRLIGPIAHALVQGTISGWLLRKLGYGNLFLATPLILLLNLVLLGISPGLFAAYAATLLIQFVFGAEGAAAHALLVRVPVEMRGRVAAWVTGTLPQSGYLLACILLFGADWLGERLNLSAMGALRISLGLAMVLAVVNLVAARWLRRTFLTAPPLDVV